MKTPSDHFNLTHFEGSLDFLLCLIQKEEMDICHISIQEIIQQFINKMIDCKEEGLERGAEFIGSASYLIWLKSQSLLPPLPISEENALFEEDPHFEIIHHLVDYCRFKQAAKELSHRQEKQQICYFRGIDIPEWKKPLGIDHLSLEELTKLFKDIIDQCSEEKRQIYEENWRVSDKIKMIRNELFLSDSFPLISLFSPEQSRGEMIVIFLAILELMKSGELAVGRDTATSTLLILGKKEKKND